MRVCFDTNVLMRVFTQQRSFPGLLRALLNRRLTLAVSNEILFEYQEVITRLYGSEAWNEVEAILERLHRLDCIVEVSPAYRFNVISADPDDNKFVDCAIAANATYVVSYDRHFDALASSAYQPRIISPEELVSLL